MTEYGPAIKIGIWTQEKEQKHFPGSMPVGRLMDCPSGEVREKPSPFG